MKRIVLTVLLIVTVFAAVGCTSYPKQVTLTQTVNVPLEVLSISSPKVGEKVQIEVKTIPGQICGVESLDSSLVGQQAIADSSGYIKFNLYLQTAVPGGHDCYVVALNSNRTKALTTLKTGFTITQ